MADFEGVKRALSSVKVHPGATGSYYVELSVPIGPEKESISFCIKLAGNKLEQVVADVTDATGTPTYSGFIASGGQPMCPVYKHA